MSWGPIDRFSVTLRLAYRLAKIRITVGKESAMLRRSLVYFAASIPLVACGDGSSSGASDYSDGSRSSSIVEEFDEDAANDRAVDELAYETYSTIGAPYGCTDDCSGHDAGFEWAKNNGVRDGSCYGDGQSFVEGCQAYGEAIQDKVDQYRNEFESSNF